VSHSLVKISNVAELRRMSSRYMKRRVTMISKRNLKIIIGILLSSGVLMSNFAKAESKACMAYEVSQIRSKCKPGDILVFTPDKFGNAQMPLIISASACNFNKPIVWNSGGVACELSPPRKIRE